MLAWCMLLAATAALAPPRTTPSQAGSVPRLVVVITLDQLRYDYLVRYRDQFTGGFARLLREGAVFTEAYQDHAVTQTAPGHSTILSGRHPASTGIVRNADGVGDSTVALLETRGPGASPRRFRGTTLHDWIAARFPDSRVLSVGRKDRSTILPVGRSRQAAYWYANGLWTTSTYYADSLPGWVRAFNARRIPHRAAGWSWDLLLPPSAYAEPDSQPYENGGREVVFPHRLPDDTARAVARFPGTPWMDEAVFALALEGVHRLGLGRSRGIDVLVVNPASADDIGHAFGPHSREIHDQVLRLDRTLGAFLDSLFRLRDQRQVLMALTADHGVTPLPAYLRAQGDTAARYVSFDSLVRGTWAALAAAAGSGEWLRYFDSGLLVLDRGGLAARGVNVDSVVAAFAEVVRRSPAVLRVDTKGTLAEADTATDTVARRWLHSLPPDLPAELMVTLKPGMTWGRPPSAGHGQPSSDDCHVPLILAGPGIRRGTYPARVSVVDLVPTLATLLGVQPLERVDGRVLREALAR